MPVLADEKGFDACLLLRRPFGDGLGKILEHGIGRRPVGRIARVGFLAVRKLILDPRHAVGPSHAVFVVPLELGQEFGVLRGADRPLLELGVELLSECLAGRHPVVEIGHRHRVCLIRLFGRVPRVVPLGLADAAQDEPRAGSIAYWPDHENR